MKQTSENALRLEEEIAEGENAERIYNIYLKKYIRETTEQVFESLKNMSSNDMDSIMRIKMKLDVLEEMRIGITTKIETARMAKDLLEDDQ